jgi:hypothetical protein
MRSEDRWTTPACNGLRGSPCGSGTTDCAAVHRCRIVDTYAAARRHVLGACDDQQRITLNFILDTGASDVSVPANVVFTLIRTGTIQNTDFLGTQRYQLADGSVAPSTTLRIRMLKIGDRQVENVKGSVASANGPLLLGQSFLSRFKSWSIDNQRHALILN